jgi:type II secretory pathway component PulF
MPIYHYQALDSSGQVHKGSLDAASINEVRQNLKSQQLFPTEVKLSRFSRTGRRGEPLIDFKKWLPERITASL